jgi:hypothetical protein
MSRIRFAVCAGLLAVSGTATADDQGQYIVTLYRNSTTDNSMRIYREQNSRRVPGCGILPLEMWSGQGSHHVRVAPSCAACTHIAGSRRARAGLSWSSDASDVDAHASLKT